MSTASSMKRAFYLQTFAVALACVSGGCKKRSIADDPKERGMLTRIASRLDEDLGSKPLPNIAESEKLADRLSKWDDFRSCTVRTFVARKREADRLKREGLERPMRNATIGEAAVEECAVESAIVKKDPAMCERLAVDYEGPNGETPLGAIRCWDTRARVFGKPEECPVVWLSDDLPGRNPECLALARRDGSLCAFADDPPRCRALLVDEPAACQAAAPDCVLAVNYWSGLIPVQLGPPLIELAPPKEGERPVFATVDVRWPQGTNPTLRIDGPQSALGLSWPAGKTRPAMVEDTKAFWGGTVGPEAAQLTWRAGQPAVKIAFAPGGASTGVRPIRPPGPLAPATVMLSWPDPRAFRHCLPGPQTTGQVEFDAGAAKPGSFVTGTLEAKDLACSDGTTVSVAGKFRLVILDVR
jgi:hypothetical protein